jgi:DNA repair protein REV1
MHTLSQAVVMVVQELKQLMALHGGGFANYYSKDTVTHIVCDHLPDTKLKQLLKSRSALPIVRAAWVVHSIASGRLLPPAEFALERLSITPAQKRLAPAPDRQAMQLQKAEIYPQLQQQQQRAHATAVQGEEAEGIQYVRKRMKAAHTATDAQSLQPGASPCVPGTHVGTRAHWPTPPPPCLHDSGQESKPWSTQQINAANKTAAAMRAACDVLKGPPKSSADDPAFMDTYFRASRLHFIGTWRTRTEELLRNNSYCSGLAKSLNFQSEGSNQGKADRCRLGAPCF